MEKNTTLHNLLKQEAAIRENTAASPSQESIDFLLNYSKSLEVKNSEKLGDVFQILN